MLFVIEFYNEPLLKTVKEFALQLFYHLFIFHFIFYLVCYESSVMLSNYYFLKFCFVNVHFWLAVKILN